MSNDDNNQAIVLFSGGQDSTVCLAWALERYARVETIGFDYGQRHEVELACRAKILAVLPERFADWGKRLGADHLIKLDAFGHLSETALTRKAEITMSQSGLPTTFVPGRNLLFFTYAAALGYRRGIKQLIGGMCETDFCGYPDCRDDALQALAEALKLGMAADFKIETPLMRLSKAETWGLAHELGRDALIDFILEETHSCYRGVREQRHAWGYGCAACPACELRAKGFAEWQSTIGDAHAAEA